MKRDLIVIAGLLLGAVAGAATYQYVACQRFVAPKAKPKCPDCKPSPKPKPKPKPCPDPN